ncbi:MAG: hypothetical protein ACOYB2_19690 [Limnohabitans sp.]
MIYPKTVDLLFDRRILHIETPVGDIETTVTTDFEWNLSHSKFLMIAVELNTRDGLRGEQLRLQIQKEFQEYIWESLLNSL